MVDLQIVARRFVSNAAPAGTLPFVSGYRVTPICLPPHFDDA
ncbi:hypothetical protein [Mesorhizobium escarrei]